MRIKEEKDTKVLPENIKHDVTMFGVIGTYEGDPTPIGPDYLCFTANTAGSTIQLHKTGSDLVSLKYSLDNVNWNDYTIESVITLANTGDKVYFKGNNTRMYGHKFVMTGSIAASGNVMSLIDETCESLTINQGHCFVFTTNFDVHLFWRNW